MRLYTVIGLHDDLGTVSWRHVEAKTALEAMIKVAKSVKDKRNFQIIGAIAGKHEMETPGSEEHHRASYASDLAFIDEEG